MKEIYIARKIDAELYSWKEDINRKPLLLRGVRQCGKTSSVRNLGKQFSNFIEINFEKEPTYKQVFEGNLDIRRICSEIELKTSIDIEDGKTLLFMDEIQLCPKAITSLRYFKEERPDLHVIAAGSLLEFIFSEGKIEFPVGRVRSMYMYPLSFNEFVQACGKNTNYECISDIMHEEYLSMYKTFLIVGGMPEAVTSYIHDGSYIKCQRIHRDIVNNFEDDFDKYSKLVSASELKQVFEFCMRNAGNQVILSHAVPQMKAANFSKSLDLLSRAGLVFQIRSSTCESLPLGSGNKNIAIKPAFFDTGILLTKMGFDVSQYLHSQDFDSLNKGAIVELQTGLEIVKNSDNQTEGNLFFWKNTGANAEIDYVVQRGSEIIPVEVKANTTGKMQSMKQYMTKHDVSYGIRVSFEKPGTSILGSHEIKTVPVYAASMI